MKLSRLKKATNVPTHGRWIGELPDLPGLRLKVRPFGNPDDKRIQMQETEAIPLSQKLRGRLSDDAQHAIMTKRLRAILEDWEGLEEEDGQPIVFGPEIAERLLTDPETEGFRDAVIWAATVAQAEANEDGAAAAKN